MVLPINRWRDPMQNHKEQEKPDSDKLVIGIGGGDIMPFPKTKQFIISFVTIVSSIIFFYLIIHGSYIIHYGLGEIITGILIAIMVDKLLKYKNE